MATASLAQARLLLTLWMHGPRPYLEGHVSWQAVRRRGWVTPTGETFTYPSMKQAPVYRINEAGWDATRNALARVQVRG